MRLYRQLIAVLPLVLAVNVYAQTATPPEPIAATEEAIDPADLDSDDVLNVDDRCANIPGATDVDENGCPQAFDPAAELVFDHEAHERWYGRFWTGNCRGVPGFCIGGDPAWFDVTEEIVAQVPEDEQAVVRNRLWAAGRTIGYEWSSDPDLNDKQIFTRQLRRWGNQLERSDEVLNTLTEIEGEVCELLGTDAFVGGYTDADACQPTEETATTEEP